MLLATQRASTCDIAYAPPEHVVNMDHPSALHKNVFVGRGVEGGGIQHVLPTTNFNGARVLCIKRAWDTRRASERVRESGWFILQRERWDVSLKL